MCCSWMKGQVEDGKVSVLDPTLGQVGSAELC